MVFKLTEMTNGHKIQFTEPLKNKPVSQKNVISVSLHKNMSLSGTFFSVKNYTFDICMKK